MRSPQRASVALAARDQQARVLGVTTDEWRLRRAHLVRCGFVDPQTARTLVALQWGLLQP
ncbi:MAG TPA: hypothetical protein PKJ45_03040 [Rubrivivax sp.]|nr:hypothetical protein [Rubrivivax sp.]